jgi:MFS family permease
MTFNVKNHVIKNTLYAIFNVTFIKIIIIPFFRSNNMDPLQISTLQTTQQITWFIFLLISGVFFDLFGPKMTFLLGRIAEIIAVSLLLKPNFYNFVVSMILIGVGLGITYGKYTSYIYNSLSLASKLNIYPRIASAYYLAWDIAFSAMSYICSLVLKNHGYEAVIYISIGLKVFAILAVILLIPNNKKSNMDEFKSSSIKEIFSSVKECIKRSNIFIYLLIFYGVANFFTYPLCMTIADMILVDKGWNAADIARYMTIISLTMAIGTIMPIIFFPQGISIKNCVLLSVWQIIALIFVAITYNTISFVIIANFICATFSLVEVSVERRFEEFSNKKIRGSAMSASIALGTLLTTFNIMLIGVVAKYFSYHLGLIIIAIQMLAILLFLFLKLKHLTN